MADRRVRSIARRDFLKRGGALALGSAFAGVAAGCGGARKPAKPDVPSPMGFLLESLEKKVPALMAQHRVPGVSLAVMRAGEISASRGFGVLEAGRSEPVTAATMFEAASLGKPVFAHAVMKLAEGGKLDLDRPLLDDDPEAFTPSIPEMMAAAGDRSDPRLRKITPRLILSHQSGLPNWSFGKPLRLVQDPGAGFVYSGEGYVYLQGVVEKLAGDPIDTFMKKRLLAPLAMRFSDFVWSKEIGKRLASGHDRDGAPQPPRRQERAAVASSLYTSAAEYAGFLLAVLDPVEEDLVHLDAATTRIMLSPAVTLDGDLSWGLGWGLERTREGLHVWHWGDNEIYKNFVMMNRDTGSGVVVFTNAAGGLNVCAGVVKEVLGEDHPALAFHLLSY